MSTGTVPGNELDRLRQEMACWMRDRDLALKLEQEENIMRLKLKWQQKIDRLEYKLAQQTDKIVDLQTTVSSMQAELQEANEGRERLSVTLAEESMLQHHLRCIVRKDIATIQNEVSDLSKRVYLIDELVSTNNEKSHNYDKRLALYANAIRRVVAKHYGIKTNVSQLHSDYLELAESVSTSMTSVTERLMQHEIQIRDKLNDFEQMTSKEAQDAINANDECELSEIAKAFQELTSRSATIQNVNKSAPGDGGASLEVRSKPMQQVAMSCSSVKLQVTEKIEKNDRTLAELCRANCKTITVPVECSDNVTPRTAASRPKILVVSASEDDETDFPKKEYLVMIGENDIRQTY
jgi:hypothetical protein